jgi:T3SS (YopN, CesT) and YbjN peptide-binding chaperone 1/T3SS (YopN, CesT) and YbjN peptide-binding chaperone 3
VQHQLPEDGCEFLSLMGWRGNDEDERNWYVERPVKEAAEIAEQVVSVLRDHFGVAHPSLMTYQAWGPAAEGAKALGLCATGEVPIEAPWKPALAFEPDDRDQLRQIVEDTLRSKLGTEPTVDDDGDFVLEHLGQAVWVRVRADQPAVEIFARVAHGVYSRRATALEIGILNRDNLWVRWTLRDRGVWQTLALPALPFVPDHLVAMLAVFLQTMTATRDDLVLRTRAKVA